MRVVSVLQVVLVVVYPFFVYWGLSHFDSRKVVGLCGVALLPSLLARAGDRGAHSLRPVLAMVLSVAILIGLGAWFNDARFAKALPVLINLSLLASFVQSLRGTPMVERFARLRHDLSPAQVRYCRSVTQVWSAFFLVNAWVTAWLAVWGSTGAWAVYTGGLSYGLIGLLGTGEYIVRKARFRDYGAGLHDRLLARVFPPPAGGREA